MAAPAFSVRQIDAFVAAAELCNFTLTARKLHLTPSAVSNIITELEATLGFAVFERTTRKVALTADGRKFLPSAIAVQRQLVRAAAAAADIRERSGEIVRIAAPLSVAAMILPVLIAEFRAAQPRITIRVIDTGVAWLSDRVAIGEADMALGPDRNEQGEIRATNLFPSPWVIWCSSSHEFASRELLRWQDLCAVEVYAAGRDHEQLLNRLLNDGIAAPAPSAIQVVDNMTTALGMAAAGLGVTFSPQYVVPLARSLGLIMRPILDPEVIRWMTLFQPVDRKLTPSAQSFLDFLSDRLTAPPPID